MIKKIGRGILTVKSARGVSFSLTLLTLFSRALGYLRTLITAWAFGTSAGMDAYYLAFGVLALFVNSVGEAAQSAILPELVRLRTEGRQVPARTLMSAISGVTLVFAFFVCLAFFLVPDSIIRFFAGGFDSDRLSMASTMIFCLLPYLAVNMARPLLEVWALYNEKYTLSALCNAGFNAVAIPALLLLIPHIGVYAVAVSSSVAYVVVFAAFALALGGLPISLRFDSLRPDSCKRVLGNVIYSILITASVALYIIVDRYFASRLEEGAVAAISYSSLLINVILTTGLVPLSYFLTRVSREVWEREKDVIETVHSAISIVITYFVPLALFLVFSAESIVSLIYGWGSFGENSVAMTALTLKAYAVGLPFILMQSIIFRYSLARQELGRMILISYFSVCLNFTLDMLLVGRFGLWGLAGATAVTQTVSFVTAYCFVMRLSLRDFILTGRTLRYVSVLLAAGLLASIVATVAPALTLFFSILFITAAISTADRLDIMPGIPPHWRPRGLLTYLRTVAAGLLGKRGE